MEIRCRFSGALVASATLLGLFLRELIRQRRRKRRYVIGIGVAVLDMIAEVDEFPVRDQKHRSQKLTRVCGGNAAVTLATVAAMGGQPILWTALGTDPDSRYILRHFSKRGVNMSHAHVSASNSAPFSYIIAHKGTRTILHQPQIHELPTDYVPRFRRILTGASWLHLDTRHSLAAAAAAGIARALNIPISLDVERTRPGVEQLISVADVIVCSADYLKTIHSCDYRESLRALSAKTRASCIIGTRGAEGSTALLRRPLDEITPPALAERTGDSQFIHCPAAPVEDTVDSTGAGDVYIGVLIHMLNEGLSVDRAMLAASYVAAESLSHIGGTTAITRKGVKDALGF